MNRCFEYQPLAQRAGLLPDELRELERVVRAQYGSDEMMIELRLLRTLQALADGDVSWREVQAEFAQPSRSTAVDRRA